MIPHFLILSGLGDSGPQHWQSYWLKQLPNTTKIEQDNWDKPQLDEWLDQLNQTLQTLEHPTILIAHSLSTILVAHWTQKYQHPNIIGALLVAPADVESVNHTPETIWNFAPIPREKMPFPTIVVGSENDPYMTLPRAKELANTWGSEFINIGEKGHINSDSNLGDWEEGKNIAFRLTEMAITKFSNHSPL